MQEKIIELIRELIPDNDERPNRLTLAVGELVKNARGELGYSQADLAKISYRRRATISDIENGKSEITLTTLLYLSAALNKPITFFFPDWALKNIVADELSANEREILSYFRDIASESLQRIAVDQVKILRS